MRIFPECPLAATRRSPTSAALVLFWGAFAGLMWALSFDKERPADVWAILLLVEAGMALAWLTWVLLSSFLARAFKAEFMSVLKADAWTYPALFFSSITAINLVFQTRTVNQLAFAVTAMMFVAFQAAVALWLALKKRGVRFAAPAGVAFAVACLSIVIHIGYISFVGDVEYWRDGEEYSLKGEVAGAFDDQPRSYFNADGEWRPSAKLEGSNVLRSKMTVAEPGEITIASARVGRSSGSIKAALYVNGNKIVEDRIEAGARWKDRSWPVATGEVEMRVTPESGSSFVSEPVVSNRRVRPNIFIIVIDTLRADHLSCYGYPRKTTPRIDELAATGALYKNNFSASSWSTGAVASIMTGLYPTQHGCVDIRGLFLPLELETFPEIMRANGYRTIGVSGNPLLSLKLGFAQGFDVFDEKCFENVNWRSGECMTDRTLGLVDGGGPMMVYMQYFDPHAPQVSPRPDFLSFRGWPFDFDFGRAMRLLTNRYDEKVRYGDRHVGRLIDGLAKKGLLDNAYVIITADHGEELGERGRVAHGFTVYNEVTHTPLIIVGPGVEAGKRYDTLTSSIDLFPTALALAGIEHPAPGQGFNLIDPTLITREFVFADNLEHTAIRSARWKFVANNAAGREELYDVVADPRELLDIAAKHPDVRAEYHAKLDEFLGKISAIQPPRTHAVDLGKAMRGRLKSLGYTQ